MMTEMSFLRLQCPPREFLLQIMSNIYSSGVSCLWPTSSVHQTIKYRLSNYARTHNQRSSVYEVFCIFINAYEPRTKERKHTYEMLVLVWGRISIPSFFNLCSHEMPSERVPPAQRYSVYSSQPLKNLYFRLFIHVFTDVSRATHTESFNIQILKI
jgi:hypothetical protein